MLISKAIETRKTEKVLSDEPWDLPEDLESIKNRTQTIIKSAYYAPFHFAAQKEHLEGKELNSIVPWRVHVLHADQCRALADYIKENEISAGKILQMLHTADALLQITWLPDGSSMDDDLAYEGNLRNMEHIAAASAATQNILLTATSYHVPNYWSSGGVLRKPPFADYLGLDQNEILLGSIFLFPEDVSKAKVAFGGLREKKGSINQWSRTVELKR